MTRTSLALVIIGALGCGSGSSTTPTTENTADTAGEDTTPSEDVAMEDTAPACGTNVGDILCDLPLEGYVRDGNAMGLANEVAYAPAKLSEVLAQGTQKYALIWTSAYW